MQVTAKDNIWSVIGGGAVIWLQKYIHLSPYCRNTSFLRKRKNERELAPCLHLKELVTSCPGQNYQEQSSEGQKLKLNSLVSLREVTLTACCPVISKCWYFLAFDSEPLKLFISKFKRCRYYYYSKCFKCTNIIKYQVLCTMKYLPLFEF